MGLFFAVLQYFVLPLALVTIPVNPYWPACLAAIVSAFAAVTVLQPRLHRG
jgi:hypothetical protein